MNTGVYVEEGPDRDALTEALARENYLPVYLDPRTVLSSDSLCVHIFLTCCGSFGCRIVCFTSEPSCLRWKCKIREAWGQ